MTENSSAVTNDTKGPRKYPQIHFLQKQLTVFLQNAASQMLERVPNTPIQLQLYKLYYHFAFKIYISTVFSYSKIVVIRFCINVAIWILKKSKYQFEKEFLKIHLQGRLTDEIYSDCNWTRTQNHLVLKRTLNHLAKLDFRVWIHSETRT